MSRDSDEVLARFHAELELVEILARQLARRVAASVSVDDLASFGREGLLHAARTFDASRGVPFRRWANLRIRGAMIDGIRRWGGLPRRVYRDLRALEAGDSVLEAHDEEDAANPATTAERAEERLSEYLTHIATALALAHAAPDIDPPPSEGADTDMYRRSPEEVASARERASRVREVVATLPERERALVERHYFEGETLDAAAAALGLSKSWGSRLHARAIETIARELRKVVA